MRKNGTESIATLVGNQLFVCNPPTKTLPKLKYSHPNEAPPPPFQGKNVR